MFKVKTLFSKLGTRIVLAMMLVALFSSLVIVTSLTVGVRLHFLSLPAEVRADLESRGRPPPRPVFSPRPEPANPPISPLATIQLDAFATGLATVQDYQRRAIYLGMSLATFLASILAVILSRGISNPIERVSKAASYVAKGDLRVRVPNQPRSSHEVHALTENFNLMAGSLEKGEQERRAMVADIAHELRTPLTAMQLRLQGLEDDLIPLDKTQIKKLHSQTEVLTRLVEDLRTLSLADAGRLSLKKREVDIVKLLDNLCDNYQVKAKETCIRLEFQSTFTRLKLSLDPERMIQIVSNLLDNALRVTPETGAVTVLLEQDDDIFIHVADSGTGLSEEVLDQLFDRFFQDRDSKGSSGLGLAIVKTLIELHGGTVTASNSEKGACFSVRLPI